MTWWNKLRWHADRRRREQELQEEIAFHLEAEAEENAANGLQSADARNAARRHLGNPALIAEDTRRVWGWTLLEQAAQDLRYALRTMRKSPGFTALAVLLMALGIGANTVVYSFMDSFLLRSLPVADPESLVVLNWFSHARPRDAKRSAHVLHSMDGSTHDDPVYGMTSPDFPFAPLAILAKQDSVFSSLFGYAPSGDRIVRIKEQANQANGVFVTGDYFRGLAIAPAAGRLLAPADDQPNAAPAIVLSYAYCIRHFGDPANAVGQPVSIDNMAFTVAGVAPPEFFGIDAARAPDFYLPMATYVDLNRPFGSQPVPYFTDQNFYWMEMMGRLRPGVTREQAQAALAPLFKEWVASTASNDEERANLPNLLLKEGAAGLETLRRNYSKPLYLLLTITALILALTCANTANLLLARAAARRREMAVRLSMGAGRLRILRQLLTESVLLAGIGGALGIALATLGVPFLTHLFSRADSTFAVTTELNWNVLAVTFLLSMCSGIVFGLAPAIQSTRTDVVPALKETRGTAQVPRRFGFLRISLSHALVALQIAISLVILVGAGLFQRTLANLQSVQLGFNRENVLLFQLNARQAGLEEAQINPLYNTLRDRFQAISGVRAASYAHASLLKAGRSNPLSVAGVNARNSRILYIGADFFATMQIPILQGRATGPQDRQGSPPVVIINEAFAAKYFPTGNPVGGHIAIGGTDPQDVEVVGVCANVRYGGLKGDIPPTAFLVFSQAPFIRSGYDVTYAVRTAGDPNQILHTIHEVVDRTDSRIPVTKVRTQAAEIDQAIKPEAAFAQLCTGFALLALVIACTGLYGTMAYNVSRRTGEIGIRMALGAARGTVIWMVLRDVLLLAVAGMAIGLPAAWAAAKLIESFLFRMQPNDPRALTAALLILLAAILAAGFAPARRASRIEPMAALRQE